MSKVVIISGAGISAESGISTFRDSDGLWEEYDRKKICTAGCLETNRVQTLEFYDKRRLDIEDKQPNKVHTTLTKLKKLYKNDIAIITQNVDDLFEKAGLDSSDVIHLHGFLTQVRCEKCGYTYDIGYKKIVDSFNGKCPNCWKEKIRPDIVMFGETAPQYEKLYSALSDCEFLVVLGTSGNVLDVTTMARHIPSSILNNLEKSDAIDDSVFTKALYKKATEAIDEIEETLKSVLGEPKATEPDTQSSDKKEVDHFQKYVQKISKSGKSAIPSSSGPCYKGANGMMSDAGLYDMEADDAYDRLMEIRLLKKAAERVLEEEHGIKKDKKAKKDYRHLYEDLLGD